MKAVQLMLVPEAACSCGKRRRPRRYGVPYLGSKNRLASEIVALLPAAAHFYDLFAGGCAVAHAALESGKWETVHVNDVDPMGIELFVGAVRGEYRDERRVIDRETFERLKGTDPYVRWCWSFGCNGRDYLWDSEMEGIKLAQSRCVAAEGIDGRAAALSAAFRALLSTPLGALPRDESVLRLQWHGRLRSFRDLDGAVDLSRLEATELDYRAVPIDPDSVVYCDIPYGGTCTGDLYGAAFDREAFYDWAESVPNVWISEYSMPEDRFECVWSRPGATHYSGLPGRSTKTVERLYRPRRRS